MRAGQLLDGFPLHLLTGAGPDAVTVVLDSDTLGRLQLGPGAMGRETQALEPVVIALARDAEVLRGTRDGWDENHGRCPWLVRADPHCPPFLPGSVDGLLHSGDAPLPITQALSRDAWVAGVESAQDWARGAKRRDRATARSAEYFIRPACDREYFATRAWAVPDWPFAVLQLGRLRELRLAINRWAGRSRIARLYDGARIGVERHGSGAPVEELIGDSEGFGLFVKVAWNALLLGVEGGRRIAKFPLNHVASTRMDEQALHLAGLFEGDDPLAAYVPRVTAHGALGGQEYWIETMCPGTPATKVPLLPRGGIWGAAWKRRAAREGVDFIIALHSETQVRTRISEDLFEQFTKLRIETITREARRIEPDFDLAPFAASLWRALADREIPLVQTHGDYWPGNVLVTHRAELAAVLDWDASETRGWPLLDLFHFIAFQHKRRAFWRFGPTLSNRLEPRKLPAWELELADGYCRQLGIPDDLWTPFVCLYWLERVSQWLVTDFHAGKRNDPWLRRNVVATAPALTSALDHL